MGLTFKPTYRVLADGRDISGLLAPRLSSLDVVDRAGIESDTATITLADTGPLRVEMPRTGAELEIFMGYAPTATRMGRYIVDEVEISGPPDQMTITAHASPHEATRGGITALQTQRSRSFPVGTTLGALVQRLAADHGLQPAISEALASIPLPHIDQLAESDMSLLTRIAGMVGAIAKPAGGRLAVVRRGQGTSASGAALPVVTLRPRDVSSWSMRISQRDPAGSVVAVWRDLESAADREAIAGEGEPQRRLRNTFPDEASAQRAAEAELERSRQRGATLRLSLPGRTDLMAEGRVQMAGWRDGVAGEWLIESVTHRIESGGYSCSVEAVRSA